MMIHYDLKPDELKELKRLKALKDQGDWIGTIMFDDEMARLEEVEKQRRREIRKAFSPLNANEVISVPKKLK